MSAIADGELERVDEIRRAWLAGDVSAAELVGRALDRARAWQSATNAFSQLWADEAMEQARARDVERSVAGGPAAGALAGVPVAVKDLFDVAGHETTGCSRAYAGTVASTDAPVVAAIRRAGAIVIGKTNQHELAAGGTNLASACGPTANPWDPVRITGGSSGGSGASVAAGIVPVALGSDTGGSIRIPASLCGAFGITPTHGALSLEGVMPLAPSMDCPGPLASTAGDLATAFAAMSGSDLVPAPPAGAGVARGAVAVARGFFADVVDPQTAATVDRVADELAGAGVRVMGVDGAGLEGIRSVWMTICCVEFDAAHRALRDPAAREQLDPQVRDWLDRGARTTERELADAMRRREDVRRWYRERLAGVDALLLPTTPYAAPRADAADVALAGGRVVDLDRVGPGYLTCSVNLAGLPALNLPAGRSRDGLPIGVSLVGGANAEGTLLDLAAAWERAVEFAPARPPLPSNPAPS